MVFQVWVQSPVRLRSILWEGHVRTSLMMTWTRFLVRKAATRPAALCCIQVLKKLKSSLVRPQDRLSKLFPMLFMGKYFCLDLTGRCVSEGVLFGQRHQDPPWWRAPSQQSSMKCPVQFGNSPLRGHPGILNVVSHRFPFQSFGNNCTFKYVQICFEQNLSPCTL